MSVAADDSVYARSSRWIGRTDGGSCRHDNPTRSSRRDSAFNPRTSGPRCSRGRGVSSLGARRQKFTRADLYSRTRRYHTSRSAWQYGVSRTIARPPALYHSANILRSHDHRDDHVTRGRTASAARCSSEKRRKRRSLSDIMFRVSGKKKRKEGIINRDLIIVSEFVYFSF